MIDVWKIWIHLYTEHTSFDTCSSIHHFPLLQHRLTRYLLSLHIGRFSIVLDFSILSKSTFFFSSPIVLKSCVWCIEREKKVIIIFLPVERSLLSWSLATSSTLSLHQDSRGIEILHIKQSQGKNTIGIPEIGDYVSFKYITIYSKSIPHPRIFENYWGPFNSIPVYIRSASHPVCQLQRKNQF